MPNETTAKSIVALCVTAMLLVLVPFITTRPVEAQNPPPAYDITQQCFAVADERDNNGKKDSQDALVRLNRTNGQTLVIGLTGTKDIEAIAFGPLDTLYATDGGQLGTLDLNTGRFTPKPKSIDDGIQGNGIFTDVDGLFFDIGSNILWGVQRVSGKPDLLFQIDPVTGVHVPGVFAGRDFVEIQPTTLGGKTLGDLDDIAVDPVDGVIYGATNSGGTGGALVKIDPKTGATTTVAEFRYPDPYPQNPALKGQVVDDIEGLSFFNDGQLYGSTGNNGPDNNDKNQLFTINKNNGLVTRVGAFPTGYMDYEALACLTAPAFLSLKKLTNGEDANTPPGPFVPPGSTVTWIYTLTNTGPITLTDLILIDDKIGQIGPGGVSNCPPANLILNPGDSLTCTATGVAQAGQYVNSAIVTGTRQVDNVSPRRKVSATDLSHYFGNGAAIVIKKATNGAEADTPPGPRLPVGSPVAWTYAVTNTGNVPLTAVTVSDDQGVVVTCPKHDLAPQETMICTGAGSAVAGQYTNLGIVSGLPPAGPLVTDSNPSHYFGYVPTGAIGDYVWQDFNLDGLQNKDEPGLENVTVELWRDGNQDGTPDLLYAQQATRLDGSYRFTDVITGAYFVKFVPPPGYLLTARDQGNDEADSDPDPVTQFAGPLLVVPQPLTLHVDAGLIKVGTIGDFVWEDANGDGEQDADEGGAGGVAVTLWLDSDQNGQPDQQLPTVLQTGNDGRYSFPNLDPRPVYYVKFVPTDGRTLTTADVPPDDQRDSDAAPTTGFAGPLQLAFGEVNNTVDAGVLPTGASVSGNVWLGTNPAGPTTGIVNATVWLKELGGVGVMTTTTGSEGHYAFVELLPKSYRVEVDTHTLPAQVTPVADRDGPPVGVVTVTLNAGQVLTNVYFLYQPFLPPAQISGRVWPDNNGNGQQDASGESEGLSAWQVLLKNRQGGVLSEQRTTPAGTYTFTNVISGSYIVEVVPPPEPYRQTFDPDDRLDHQTVITVTAGQIYAPVDFGYQPLSYLAGLVWQDRDKRAPLPGITLILTDSHGQRTETRTNPDGKYQFASLPPGNYTVCVNNATLPAGSVQVEDPDGVLDHCHALELLPSENRENVNFGYEVPPPGLVLSCQINGVDAGADPGPSVLTAQTATWEYRVTNRTDRTLSNVSLVEPLFTIKPCGAGTLAPQGSTTCKAEKSVTVGRQVGIAHAEAQDEAGQPVSSERQACYSTGYTAEITLTLLINGKKAEPNNGPYLVQGSPITWSYQVTNTGTATVTDVRISAVDGNGPLPDNGNGCQLAELLPGATASCPPVSAIAQRGLQMHSAQATGQPIDAFGRRLDGRITALAQGNYHGGGTPTLVLRPAEAEQAIGLWHGVTATLTISGQQAPADLPIYFQVTPQGAEALPAVVNYTNDKGEATFSYRNTDNRQERTDTIVAWLNVEASAAAALAADGPAPEDIADDAVVHWRQLVLTNTDTLSSFPEPVRIVTAYVSTQALGEKAGQPVAGLRVGFTAKLGSGEIIPPLFGLTDEQGRAPFTITPDRVIAPTTATLATAMAVAASPAATTAQPLIGVTDLITLWVDIDTDAARSDGEPFELVDATTNLPYASFTRVRRGDQVNLIWSTAVANQYAAFNLYRSTVETELGSKRNGNPIGQDENSQFYYSYADTLPGKGVYYYWLEAIGFDNQADKPIGPFLVIWGEDLYLPMIQR